MLCLISNVFNVIYMFLQKKHKIIIDIKRTDVF